MLAARNGADSTKYISRRGRKSMNTCQCARSVGRCSMTVLEMHCISAIMKLSLQVRLIANSRHGPAPSEKAEGAPTPQRALCPRRMRQLTVHSYT